mgnify:CR=1 FL=1
MHSIDLNCDLGESFGAYTIGLDETVVIVGINIRFPNCSGRVDVCLPGMMLTNIFSMLETYETIFAG